MKNISHPPEKTNFSPKEKISHAHLKKPISHLKQNFYSHPKKIFQTKKFPTFV